jgi:hypothetical protein
MDFFDIFLLGVTYRYAIKIDHKFKKHNKREFRSTNVQQQNYGKGNHKSKIKLGTKQGNPNSRQTVQVVGKER